jgi:hypothetical protein
MYYFLNKCFDQWQCSEIATKSSRWSIYIHVWLLTYFHIFSLRLETLEYILQQHLIISHCEYQYKNGQIRTTWNYGSKTYCSSSAPKNISQFSNVSPNGGNIIYNHCRSCLQTSGFAKCFIHKISLSNRESNPP